MFIKKIIVQLLRIESSMFSKIFQKKLRQLLLYFCINNGEKALTDMFELENTNYLYALWLLPFFTVLYILIRQARKSALMKYGEMNLIERLMPDVSSYKPIIKFILAMTALFFLIAAIVNPLVGTKLEEVKRKGVDVVVAIDVSNSMLADDIKPNRLARAKQMVSRLMDKLRNDRIGIVVFAGESFLQLPLTTDYAAGKLFLSSISTEMILMQGTAIGSAIKLASRSFTDEEKKFKVIIVITDGENHEDDAVGAASYAAEKGIVVHTIGMGTVKGGPIPIKGGKEYKRDREGNIVFTKLDAAMLQQLAAAGNGEFVRSAGTDADLGKLVEEIAKMEKREISAKMFTDYESRFQYLLAPALLFLIIELLISYRKSRIIQSMNLFGGEK